MVEEEADKKENNAVLAIKIIAIVIMTIFALAYFTPKPTEQHSRFGVKVVSEIPLERLEAMTLITMSNKSSTPEELTCKFELSAISKPSPKGYNVLISEGDYGIYVTEKKAEIKGSNPAQILTACHAFACLRDGIECPQDLMAIDDFLLDATSMSVILDEDVRSAGGRGYVEIMGALSYHQNGVADTNNDGKVEQAEVDANEFFIYPFLMSDGMCTAQPMHTVLQNWSGEDEPIDCAKIGPAIFIKKDREAYMRFEGSHLVLAGPDDKLHTEAIILRDIISPRWIRRMYGLE